MYELFDPGMPIILTNPCVGCAYGNVRTFQKLEVDVMSASQRASDVISFIKMSGIEQNACQCRLIEPKRLRHINDLDEVCDNLSPYGIERCVSLL